MKYPHTEIKNITDTYFGVEVEDPYRWLENDVSAETKAWVKAQNVVTNSYLNQIPYKNQIKKRLETLWNYEKISAPFKEGNYIYYSKNNGLQNQDVIYRTLVNSDKSEVFLDLNTFSGDGTVSLGALSFSKSGSYLAYTVSIGGSDWRKVYIMDVATKTIVEDALVNVKFSQLSWFKDEGFYYSSYQKPDGSELSAKTDQHLVFYHKLNTSQLNDTLIYGGKPEEKHRYIYANVTEDNRFLVLTPRVSTSGNKLLIKNLTDANSTFKTILNHSDSDTYVLENKADNLFLVTNLNAPNKKIVSVNFNNPEPKNWTDIIPETNQVLTIAKSGGFLFAHYMVDAISNIKQYKFNGEFVRDINLPGLGSAHGFSSKKDESTCYFSFSNYYTPTSIYKLNTDTGAYKLYWQPAVHFNTENYTSKQDFYTSKDGTKIPIIITHKKGIKLNSKNPTILYGYGGFNISLTPSFSIANAVWLELGGILAVPNIRGGGEYGKAWHDAGTKMQKQNVFDDFIAAAEYLIANQYTSSEYLALRGGSNGGLLVGAVMTQRPNLAKVVLPAVGVLDMLRYHTFTAGAGWAYDYGTAEDSKDMFQYLKNYSPVHNVKQTKYPATLITTADHDDRVVPAHSFKFAAELQNKHQGKNPVLIRIETNAGHGAGTPVSKTIEQYADVFAFTLFNMNVKTLNPKN
ncbi:prolyl oligopeptidase family serine peptidase [Tamlana sp. 62-3]|uniref:prolyl oligopeptidase n=1 Tax=Neotamlana sargassicola TaxID=2883125 RepID=A0A9X1L642_9FLAO|nr:prolyl oligopeptidase family serine peptidase [Tamlana sargassicola]MCB4807199.1 prolyl oligopeptidase family serine peptidase [Tamlana sargassicola]